MSVQSTLGEMVDGRQITKNHFPLLRLPREVRDQILSNIVVPNCLVTGDWILGLCTTYCNGQDYPYRYISANKDFPIRHPIRQANKQLYTESTRVLRRLFSSQLFRLGPSDSWMIYLILQAMSTGLCSIVTAVTINADAFENNSGANKELWSGTYKSGHIGELILHKLPKVRRVQIMTQQRNCSYRCGDHFPNDECTGERYSTCSLCAQFFSEELKRGRIDRLEFVIERNVSEVATERDILSTDPAYLYWAACREPWNLFKISKTFTEKDAKYGGPPRSRNEGGWPKWTVAYEMGNRT